MKRLDKSFDERIDNFRFVEFQDINEHGFERRVSETYIDDQLADRHVVQTIGFVSQADITKLIPPAPIWASEPTIRTECDEVTAVHDGVEQKHVTYWHVFIYAGLPKRQKIGEEVYIGDTLWQESDFYSNGQRARRCVYLRRDPDVMKCQHWRSDGTKEKDVFIRYREDGSRKERETRYDEEGNRKPGTAIREYDAQGILTSE